jgi:hypothetical protein
MPADCLDINKCLAEVFFEKVVEIDQHLCSHGILWITIVWEKYIYLLPFYDDVKEEFLSL